MNKRKLLSNYTNIEPAPKRYKIDITDYLKSVNKILKKIKIDHNMECRLNINIINDKIFSTLSIEKDYINPYYLDFY